RRGLRTSPTTDLRPSYAAVASSTSFPNRKNPILGPTDPAHILIGSVGLGPSIRRALASACLVTGTVYWGRCAERQREMEPAPLVYLALDPDSAPLQLQ